MLLIRLPHASGYLIASARFDLDSFWLCFSFGLFSPPLFGYFLALFSKPFAIALATCCGGVSCETPGIGMHVVLCDLREYNTTARTQLIKMQHAI